MREADLGRRLSNPQENKDPKAAPKEDPATAPAPKADDKPEGPEVVSKSDYQLNEAVNLLKALNIVQKK